MMCLDYYASPLNTIAILTKRSWWVIHKYVVLHSKQCCVISNTTVFILCIKWSNTHTLSHRADNVAQPCFALSQMSCQPTVLHEFKAFCLETHDSACSRLSSVLLWRHPLQAQKLESVQCKDSQWPHESEAKHQLQCTHFKCQTKWASVCIQPSSLFTSQHYLFGHAQSLPYIPAVRLGSRDML